MGFLKVFMLEKLMKSNYVRKALASVVTAGIVALPTYASAQESYLNQPSQIKSLNSLSLDDSVLDSNSKKSVVVSNGGYNHNRFRLIADSSRPSYLPPKKDGSPSRDEDSKDETFRGKSPYSGNNSSSPSQRNGCGSTCTYIGAGVTVLGLILLKGVYDVHKYGQENNDLRASAIREDEKSTGPVLLGLGTLGGVALMIYGISTTN